MIPAHTLRKGALVDRQSLQLKRLVNGANVNAGVSVQALSVPL